MSSSLSDFDIPKSEGMRDNILREVQLVEIAGQKFLPTYLKKLELREDGKKISENKYLLPDRKLYSGQEID